MTRLPQRLRRWLAALALLAAVPAAADVALRSLVGRENFFSGMAETIASSAARTRWWAN